MSGFSSTDTWDSLVDEVVDKLQGYVIQNDQMCTLAGDISSSATSISVDTTGVVSRGIIEIDQELIFVSSVDSGTLTVPAWGRGYKGTTASSHTSGVAVVVSPTYPRSIAAREVNNSIRDVWPTLFAPKTKDFTIDPLKWQYEMPADTERILSAEWKYSLPDGWHPLSGWELIGSAITSDFTTGKAVAISDPLMSGVSIHVVYAARPSMFSAGSDEFVATTGLPATARDVIVLGAAARLAPWIDAGRVPSVTVPEEIGSAQKQIGNAIAIGRELRSEYASRLERERQGQELLYPRRSHTVRW